MSSGDSSVNQVHSAERDVQNLPPTYYQSLVFNATNNIGLRDIAPTLARIQSRAAESPNLVSSAGQLSSETRISIDNETQRLISPEESSETPPFCAEVTYIIEPTKTESLLFKMPSTLFLLGVLFPPFWFLGAGFYWNSPELGLKRFWATLCLGLSCMVIGSLPFFMIQ